MALTGGPHLSAACESERGVAGWLVLGGPDAVFGPRGKKEKRKDRLGWAGKREWVRVLICFIFFQILFFYFLFKF
jgi:hypothetical protein